MTTINFPRKRLSPAHCAVFAAFIATLASAAYAPPATATPEKAAKFYENAVTRHEKNDVAGAIVQLKNAIQQDPKMLAAQILLGKLLLQQGDAEAAETTFEQALRLGVDRSEIAVPMAQAALELGKPDKVLQGAGPDGLPTGPRVELLILRGHAYRATRDLDAAERSYREALALDSRNVPARLSLADLWIQQGRREVARKAIGEIMALAPKDPRPWELSGKLALAQGDGTAALDAYGKAIALHPDDTDALVARTMLLIERGALDEAAKDLDTLKRISPTEPRGLYARALYGARRDDEHMVREALQALVDAVDRVPRDVLRTRAADLLKLGGLAYYGLGQHQKARVYFEEYLLARPGDVGARKVLASILLGQGWPREAIDVLESARRAAPQDPDLLLLLGSAHMARRRYELANGYLEEALRASGGSSAAHTALGLSLLGGGNDLLGIDHLERALKKDPGQARAGLALAIIELRRGRARAALEHTEAVVRSDPKNPVAYNILGAARTAAGDRRGARVAYEKAIELQPGLVAARLNLARLEAADGDFAAARTRLETILKQQPKNREALFELALVEESARRPEEAIRLLEKARGGDRRSVAASVRLVDTYLRFRQPEKALEVAREAEATAPENLEVLGALGRAYSANGNDQLAQQSFGRMTRLAGFDPAWQTRIAGYQLASGNTAGAVQSLERALSAQPEFVPAQVMMAEVDLQRGDVARAEQRARGIAKRDPESPAAQRLLADIALATKKYQQAVDAYRKVLSNDPSTEAAIRLYRAQISAGTLKDAILSMEAWLQTNPDDAVARRALAEGYLRAGNLAAARTQFETVLVKDSTDPVVLNNLANVLLRQGDPKAVDHAQKAHQLAPQDAAIEDTLGWVLVQQGQADVGLRHLRDARLRDPQNAEIRYHLAAALVRAGRRNEARQELEQALKPGTSFQEIGDARKLLAELSAR